MKAKVLPNAGLALLAVAGMLGCSNSHEQNDDAQPEEEQVGFEILEFSDGPLPFPIRAWISPTVTQEAFDALELPEGWQKNQLREGVYHSPLSGTPSKYRKINGVL